MRPPTGTVTFLFTDIEESTRRWVAFAEEMKAALALHDVLVRTALERFDGYIFKTVGDAFCAAFSRPEDAMHAALEAQRQLVREDFSRVQELPVRISLHTGTAAERNGDYFGTAVNRAARLLSLAHGGQIVVSSATEKLLRDCVNRDTFLVHEGEHRLEGFAEPEPVYALYAEGLRRTFPPLRSQSSFPTNLTPARTSFVGRQSGIAELAALLRRSQIVTVVGTGGLGKTRLSIETALSLRSEYADGTWFVDLASARDEHDVLATIAATLGLQEQRGRSLVETISLYLDHKHVLLILDNCEQAIEAVVPTADQLLQSASSRITLLCTSREPLSIAGERTYHISELTNEEAVELFVARAKDVDHRFEALADERTTVGDICTRLDRVPLAIELAAARVRVLSLAAISEKLEHRLSLLQSGFRSAHPRQQTLRATIDWSYDLLSEGEKAVFARLSVFATSFDVEVASRVCSDVVAAEDAAYDAILALADKSLLIIDEVSRRFRLLQSTRSYAAEKLQTRGDNDAAERRYAKVMCDLACDILARRDRISDDEWYESVQYDMENWRNALRWCFSEGGDPALGQSLLYGTWLQWRRFAPIEGYRWIETARSASSETASFPVAWMEVGAASIAAGIPDACEVERSARRAFRLFEALRDEAGLMHASHRLGMALTLCGDAAAGKPLLQDAVRAMRARGLQWHLAMALVDLAAACDERDPEVDAYLNEAERICVNISAPRTLPWVWANRATILRKRGDASGALQLMQRCVNSYREQHYYVGVAWSGCVVSELLLQLERFDEARAEAAEALAVAETYGFEVQIQWAREHLAQAERRAAT